MRKYAVIEEGRYTADIIRDKEIGYGRVLRNFLNGINSILVEVETDREDFIPIEELKDAKVILNGGIFFALKEVNHE